jgi:penicillin-binding protein 1A
MEYVRTQLDETYGTKTVYESGLVVKTGLDPALQRAANRALEDGVRALDRKRGYRRTTTNVLSPAVKSVERHSSWRRDPSDGDYMKAVVTDVEGTIPRPHGEWRGTIALGDYEWTGGRSTSPAGDLIEVGIIKVDPKGTFTAKLEHTPPDRGRHPRHRQPHRPVLVIGRPQLRASFNRAIAGHAAGRVALSSCISPRSTRQTVQHEIIDEPVSFDPGPNQPPYEPKNYDHEFHGRMTYRTALEQSRNIPAIKLMNELGPPTVIKYARDLGFTAPLQPFLSTAIGSAENSLLEMVSIYSSFPNGGVRMKPLSILEVADREGNMLQQNRAEPHESIRADTAYIITTLLESAAKRGTGADSNRLKWTVAGKTGTTDDYTDAWFIGFDPDITIGVWLGYDQKKTMGREAGRPGGAADLDQDDGDLGRAPPRRETRPAHLRAPR